MQFKTLAIVFVTFAASSVFAAPTSAKRAGLDCPILDCIKGLAPTVKACAPAAIALGENIVKDISCLVDAAKLIIDFPQSCSSCASELGVDISGAFDKAKNAVEGAAHDIEGDIEGLFDREE